MCSVKCVVMEKTPLAEFLEIIDTQKKNPCR